MPATAKMDLPKLRISSKKVISPQIYDFLRKHITETTIKPGTLLSENSLSEHFNVSRQPVREAIMRLSYEGLLSVLPQRGSVVERISVSELMQTVFVRTAIEKECVMNIVNLDFKTKRHCLNQIEKAIEMQKENLKDGEHKSSYLKLDDNFHEQLCSISGGHLAWQTIQSVKGQMDRIRFLTMNTVSPTDEVTKEHEQIFDALINDRLDECLNLLTSHLSEINETHKQAIRDYRDWFTPESIDLVEKNALKERAKAAKAAK